MLNKKLNLKINSLLLEDGGVTAISPARRGNVGRPLPDSKQSKPESTSGPETKATQQSTATTNIPSTDWFDFAQRDPGYEVSVEGDFPTVKVVDQTPLLLKRNLSAQELESLKNAYSTDSARDLLTRLQGEFDSPLSRSRETTFIKTDYPEYFTYWPKKSTKIVKPSISPEDPDEIPKEPGMVPEVEPQIKNGKWVVIPQLYPSEVKAVSGATPPPMQWADSWKSLKGVIPHASEFAGEQRVVPLPNERFVTIPGQTGRVENVLNPEIATNQKWATPGQGSRVLGGGEAVDLAYDIALANRAKAAAKKASESRVGKAVGGMLDTAKAKSPSSARSAASWTGEFAGGIPRWGAHLIAGAPVYGWYGQEAYDMAKRMGADDINAEAAAWSLSAPLGAATMESVPTIASALGGGAGIGSAIAAGAEAGGAAAINPFTLLFAGLPWGISAALHAQQKYEKMAREKVGGIQTPSIPGEMSDEERAKALGLLAPEEKKAREFMDKMRVNPKAMPDMSMRKK